MICHRCGGMMIPTDEALVPAMGCVDCGRLVPRTGARPVRASRSDERALLRAERRQQMRKARAA